MNELFSANVVMALLICIGAAAATMIGSLSIFRTRESNPRYLAFGLAFAGGAMVYVSLVEIFTKAVDSFSEVLPDKEAYLYATFSFFCGIILLVLIDTFIPNPHNELAAPDNEASKDHLKRVGLLAAIAITAHNLPEGMATFFAALEDPVMGLSLAVAIAVHNIPEGVSIAIPVYYATGSRRKAMFACFVSAIAEPIGALIGYIALSSFLNPYVFGSVFGVIAGAMVFLSLDELLPSAKRYSQGHDAVYGMVTGMGCIAISLVLFR